MKFTQRLLLIILLLHLSNAGTYAQKKITYGVGIDIFQTKLNNVDREHFSGRGHSVPGFEQNDQLGFGATYLASVPVFKNLAFETGLGITNFNSQFHFDYVDTFVGLTIPIDRKLNISLYYLNLPLKVAYNFPINPSSSIHASIGINSKFLFAYYDNYEKTIVEFIGGLSSIDRYRRLIFSPELSIGYSFKFNNERVIKFEITTSHDLNRMTSQKILKRSWGFYSNLQPAYYSNYGVRIKYFFIE